VTFITNICGQINRKKQVLQSEKYFKIVKNTNHLARKNDLILCEKNTTVLPNEKPQNYVTNTISQIGEMNACIQQINLTILILNLFRRNDVDT